MAATGTQSGRPPLVLALLQHACGADPAANLAKALELAERAAEQGAQIICTQELFRSQYFCQSEDYAAFELAEAIPGPPPGRSKSSPKQPPGRDDRLALREARERALPQHRRRHRRRRFAARHLPQDAHPGRSALLREILFHARRHRLSRLEHPVRQDRRAHLLGPVVSRSGAADRAARARRSSFIRRPSAGTPRKRPGTAPSSTAPGRRSSAPRRGQRLLCGRGQPHRPRTARRRRRGSSSGARALWPARAGRSSRKAGVGQEEILLVPVDLAKVDSTRTHWPFLRDRRIDAYGELTKRFVD